MDLLSEAHTAERHARVALVELGRRLESKGLIVAMDGNFSVRLPDDTLVVTPAGSPKGELQPEDMVLTDLEGRPKSSGRPSSELAMHLGVYAVRHDVRAVVHAHPPAAIAHTIARVSLVEPLMPEAWVELGPVPTLPCVLPGTEAMRQQVMKPIMEHDVLMLERHGSLTVGSDLRSAYHRLEFLEQAAKVSLYARQIANGPVSPLPSAIRDKLSRKGPPDGGNGEAR
ncbi:MAG: class II aldolase/adducin family protein [Myxococcota bacterium]